MAVSGKTIVTTYNKTIFKVGIQLAKVIYNSIVMSLEEEKAISFAAYRQDHKTRLWEVGAKYFERDDFVRP